MNAMKHPLQAFPGPGEEASWRVLHSTEHRKGTPLKPPRPGEEASWRILHSTDVPRPLPAKAGSSLGTKLQNLTNSKASASPVQQRR